LAPPPAGSRSPHVERTLAWFARFRRLAVRYERRADILEAFHLLAAALICLRFVERWSW
jgi:transposase